MFQEKVFHDSVVFSSSIQDVKLLESSTSSYIIVRYRVQGPEGL